nr:hypothetical protein [Tanacetum cinerariifolium]
MRNKPDIDNMDIDDLYNNLKVYEADIKGSYGSSSNSQIVAFVSAESTNSINELNATYSVSTAIGHSIAEHLGIQETRVEMLGMHGTEEEIMVNELQERRMKKHWHRRTSRNPGNKGRDVGNAWYRGRDNVFTRSGRIPVSVAKPKAVASTSATKPVNNAGPKQSVNFSNSKISVVKGNGVTAVKASAGCVWRPKVNEIDRISKDNRWICTRVDYLDLQGRLKSVMAWVSKRN